LVVSSLYISAPFDTEASHGAIVLTIFRGHGVFPLEVEVVST
jgi:hypothetical protein